MDRSLYPEGVEVHQSDLKNTEDTRSFHILQRHIDNTINGVVSGLIVTPNSGNPTLIDVAPGYGYCPNGELVELENSTNAISLADYSVNAENFITLVYTETYDDLQPHETSGSSLSTKANRSVRLRVFTRSQYNALSESDDNLNNDSRDRILVIAYIIAQGSGISIPASAINLPPVFDSAINITNITNNITGVVISSAEAGTADGNGTLEFNFNNGTLTWIAPDDSTGNPINVLSGGSFDLESFPSNKKLYVFVYAAILPITNQTDTIQIQNLYYEEAPRHSANDIHHRSLVGSGIPVPNNPHGLTLSDLGISGTPIEEHQTLMHSNGIRRDSHANTLFAVVNPDTAPDELSITVNPSFYVYIRGTLYISSNHTVVSFTDIVDNTQILFDIYAKSGPNSQTDIEKRERVRFDTLSTLTTHVQLKDISRITNAGSGSIDFNDSTDTLTYTAPGDSAGEAKSIPTSGSIALRLFSDNDLDYIDLLVNNTLNGTGNSSDPLTITDLPSTNDLKDRLHISTVVYSGSATGFLGNGFGVYNYPNDILDKRLFGITSPFDIRDDAALWYLGETDEAASPATITNNQVGIIDKNYDVVDESTDFVRGETQLAVIGKAHVLKRTTEQFNILSIIQYSTAEDGLKQGIRSDVVTDFTSGTITNIANNISVTRCRHVGGTVSHAAGHWSRIDVNSGANVTNLYGLHIQPPGGTHSVATEITNEYGLKIEDQGTGINNWGIYTGVGKIRFGDEISIENAADNIISNAVSGSCLLRIRCQSNNADGAAVRWLDGSTYQGGFVRFDANANLFYVGSHIAASSTISGDTNAIRISVINGKVGVGVDPYSGADLTAGNIRITDTGTALRVLNNAQIDGILILGSYIDWNGSRSTSVILGNGNPEITVDNTAEGVATGVDDSWRIRDSNNQIDNLYGINTDMLIFEKTDGNYLEPDGSIVFVNTGRTTTPTYQSIASLFIRGNGEIHPNWTTNDGTYYGTANTGPGSQNLGIDKARWGEINAGAALLFGDYGSGAADPGTAREVIARHQRNAVVCQCSFTAGTSSPAVANGSWNAASIARVGTSDSYDITLFEEINASSHCIVNTTTIAINIIAYLLSTTTIRVTLSASGAYVVHLVVHGAPRFTQ